MFSQLDTDVASQWMCHAFDIAEKALCVNEVPVGAVFVKHPKNQDNVMIWNEGIIVASGHNLTNLCRNV